jgi:predicted nucleic acid-binding protein
MQADWVQQHRPKNQPLVIALQRDLDQGEAEGIALALELEADFLLMDEQEGRRAAERFGLKTVGVVGILLEAKARGYLDTIRPSLDALRQTAGFYLGEALYQEVLELAGE